MHEGVKFGVNPAYKSQASKPLACRLACLVAWLDFRDVREGRHKSFTKDTENSRALSTSPPCAR